MRIVGEETVPAAAARLSIELVLPDWEPSHLLRFVVGRHAGSEECFMYA
jgi:hypothetical protein